MMVAMKLMSSDVAPQRCDGPCAGHTPSFGGDRHDSFVMTGPGPAGRRRDKLQLMVGLSDTRDLDWLCLVIGSGEFALAVVM